MLAFYLAGCIMRERPGPAKPAGSGTLRRREKDAREGDVHGVGGNPTFARHMGRRPSFTA